MALDKLVDSAQLDSDLGDVADAIRSKSGGSSQLAFPAGFISEIESIQTGGGGYSYIEHYQYVQAETKDYNSGGFTSWFVNTYITKGNGLYWGKITDVTDNPSQYKAVAFYAFKTADNGISGMFKRPVNWNGGINNEASFYVYSGGIVDIWFIPETYFNS